jgi:hypothetical protein
MVEIMLNGKYESLSKREKTWEDPNPRCPIYKRFLLVTLIFEYILIFLECIILGFNLCTLMV